VRTGPSAADTGGRTPFPSLPERALRALAAGGRRASTSFMANTVACWRRAVRGVSAKRALPEVLRTGPSAALGPRAYSGGLRSGPYGPCWPAASER
jgi:hypothetical protein